MHISRIAPNCSIAAATSESRCLDVAALCYRHIGVPQNSLDGFVRNSKPVKIRRQATPKCMPTLPGQTRFDEDRHELTSAAKASRLIGFPAGLGTSIRSRDCLRALGANPIRCASCAMTGTGAWLCRVFGSSRAPSSKTARSILASRHNSPRGSRAIRLFVFP